MFSSMLLLLGLLAPSGAAAAGHALDWTDHLLFAHALGGIDGHTYTNSREAFEANYARGFRVFETDLIPTTDERMVARHDWERNMFLHFDQQPYFPDLEPLQPKDSYPLSLAEFKKLPIMDRYHGMDWSDLLQLMQEHPDIYYVLDTKHAEEPDVTRDYRLLVEQAEQVDPALLARIIPQLYNRKMLEYVDAIHPFPSYIYTLYASKDTNPQIVDFVRANPRIKAVAMQQYRATKSFIESLKKIGVLTYVHTINDYGTYLKLKQIGVHGVYTDFLGYRQVLKDKKASWMASPPLEPDQSP